MKEPTTTNWEELVREVAADRRRGKRFNLVYSIEVTGIDRAGAAFSERTKTLDISESGCRIETAMQLQRGDMVSIKLLIPGENAEDAEPRNFEIMWTSYDSRVRTAGARKLDSDEIWKVTFPPAKSSTNSSKPDLSEPNSPKHNSSEK